MRPFAWIALPNGSVAQFGILRAVQGTRRRDGRFFLFRSLREDRLRWSYRFRPAFFWLLFMSTMACNAAWGAGAICFYAGMVRVVGVGGSVRGGVFYFRYRRATGNFNYALGNIYKGGTAATHAVSLLLFMMQKVSIITSRLHRRSLPIRGRISGFVMSTLFYAVAGTGFSSRDVAGHVSGKLTVHSSLGRRTSTGSVPLPRTSRLG